MKTSSVSHHDQDKNSPASKCRTPSTFLYAENSRADGTLPIHEIHRCVASLTRIPRNHHEQVQVLRYNYLEKYNAHHDYFDNSLHRTSESTQKLVQGGKRIIDLRQFSGTYIWAVVEKPYFLDGIEDGNHQISDIRYDGLFSWYESPPREGKRDNL